MEKNLKEQVRAEIQHHISPLIGWLRQDVAKGRVDDNGDRLDQWHARSELAVEAIVTLVGEVEYEYAVQVTDDKGIVRRLEAGDWVGDLGSAEEVMENKLFYWKCSQMTKTAKIVKRRKAGKVEEL